MVKKTTMYEFVSKNGYELIERVGKSQTSLMLKISRPSIDAILREHPTRPEKTLPKYVFEWEETEGNKMFIEKYQGRLRVFEQYVRFGMKAWLLLGKKDPVSWDIEDFQQIWKAEEFKDKTSKKMAFENAVLCRKWMRALGKTDFCTLEDFETKHLKQPKGGRKQWFLEDDEIIRLIEATEEKALLVGFVLSTLGGGRASSLMKRTRVKDSKGIRPMDVDAQNCGILMFEPKRQEYILRLFHPRALELLKKYVEEKKIAPNEPIFPSYGVMRELLKSTASRANISKISSTRGSWHITKHTFVSQGAYHGLSLEVISEQTGTDPKTLMDYYAGIKEKKMRLELLGEKVDIEPFHAWSLRVIIEPATRRYEQVTREFQ